MCDRVGVLYAGKLVEEGDDGDGAAGPAPPVHGRPAALRPARRRAEGSRPARHDPGLHAERRRGAAGLRLRRSLRARRGRLRAGGAGAARRSATATRAAATSTSAPRRCPASRRRSSQLPAVDRDGRPAAPVRRPRQGLQAAGPRRPCARRRLGRDLAGRDARPRRRVGQRQDDARAGAARARAADDGRGRARREGARAARSANRDGERPARVADRLPEPRLGAQPPHTGAPDPAPLAQEARGHDRQRRRGAACTS